MRAADILVENSVIKKIGKIKKSSGKKNILDAGGRIITPGFIDLHIQGAGGGGVLDGNKKSLQKLSRTCARLGTTSFLATTIFYARNNNPHIKTAAENVGTDLGGANLLGIHLESPFISLARRGMISPDCISPPSPEVLERMLALTGGHLKMVTLAPEVKGNLKIIRNLTGKHIVASFGHSDASYEETLKGINAGISHITHLYNAMRSLHHRKPGPLLAISQSKKVSVQIISDGIHLHPAVLKFTFDLLGADRCILITDGMPALGLPNGKYVYNGLAYATRNGTARSKDGGSLFGTAFGLNQLVKRFSQFTGCGLSMAIKTVTENPAKVLGISDKKGNIEIGKDADLVLLNKDYSVWSTIVSGKIVHRKSGKHIATEHTEK